MPDGDSPPEKPDPTELTDADPGTDFSPSPLTNDARPAGPQRLGDFDQLREIGRGGMGVVYEARQISLNRRVALKVLPPGLGLTEQAVKRFEREAQAAAKLHHTNIVPVYATGQSEGSHFYAMELIEGQPLSEVLRDLSGAGSNPLLDETVTKLGGTGQVASKPETSQADSGISSLSDTQSGSRKWFDAVAKLLADVADALEYAHGRGVIHRDIKPANLMLSKDGRLCVTDFGLARVAQEPGMTVSGSLLGTPAYMSPEQITAGRVKLDHRTDVYSLGTVLYEMLAQRRPFPGDSREAVLSAILTKDPRPPRRFNPRVPLDLETIALKAMEKDPDRRYATAGELAQDLKQYLGGGLITARRATLARRAWKSMHRHPVATTVAAAVLAVGLLGGFGWRALRQANVPRLVSEARLLLLQGEHRRGMQQATAALALDPDNVGARLVRARTLLWGRREPEAVEEAQAVLRVEPDNWEAHVLLASAAYHVPSIDAAEHLAAVEGRMPDTADAHYLRGLLAGSNREAIESLDRALALDPGHLLALSERSTRHANLKDLQAALDDAERILAVRPRSALGHYKRAWVYRELHDEGRTLEACNQAIRADPEDPLGYFQRGRVYDNRGKEDNAIDDLTRAVELDPGVASYYEYRSGLFKWKHEYDRAIADAEHAVELDPDFGWGYSRLADAYRDVGRSDEASGVLDELAERASGWRDGRAIVEAHKQLAASYQAAGDHEGVLAAAERIVELQPDKMAGYMWRARARRQLEGASAIAEDCDRILSLELDEPGEFLDRARAMVDPCGRVEQATADYSRAIELAPRWAEPYLQRGYNRRTDLELGLTDLEKAVELAPTWLMARFNLAFFLHMRMERYEEAVTRYEESTELGGEGANLVYLHAGALLLLDRADEAIALHDAYLEIYPQNEWAWQRRGEALFRLGRVGEAVASLDEAIERQPAKPDPYVVRAMFSAVQGNACNSVGADLARYRELAPDGANQWSTVAYAQAVYVDGACPDLYDPSLAIESARRAVAVDPESAVFQGTLGFAAYRNGSYKEARDALMMTVELSDIEEASSSFFLAMTLEKLGDHNSARRWYDRAVTRMDETYPESPELVALKQEATELLGRLTPEESSAAS